MTRRHLRRAGGASGKKRHGSGEGEKGRRTVNPPARNFIHPQFVPSIIPALAFNGGAILGVAVLPSPGGLFLPLEINRNFLKPS
jgi:hypothetical protein